MDAARSQDELRGLVEQLLERNQDIVRRLMQLEDTYGARSRVTRQPSGEDEDDDDTATIRSANNSMATTSSSTLIDPIQFSFQADLEASRVYRRLRGNECDCSFTSSIARSHAWSVFSGLSLGEISIVSIIALPLYPADISNAEGYTFGDIWSHFGPSKEPRSALDPESLALLLEPKKNEDPVPSFKASGPLAKNSTPQADLSGANEGEDIIYPCSGCGDVST